MTWGDSGNQKSGKNCRIDCNVVQYKNSFVRTIPIEKSWNCVWQLNFFVRSFISKGTEIWEDVIYMCLCLFWISITNHNYTITMHGKSQWWLDRVKHYKRDYRHKKTDLYFKKLLFYNIVSTQLYIMVPR